MSDVYTIGHSLHPLPVFVELLERHAVALLVDVRAAPYSRRHPQFRRETLAEALAAHGIRYRWLGVALGGRRAPPIAHPHTALDEPAFQAYAEHLATADFQAALARVAGAAERHRLALMCAEADHTHCHRQFIADALNVVGHPVLHIAANGELHPHALHPALRVCDGRLVYDRHAQARLL